MTPLTGDERELLEHFRKQVDELQNRGTAQLLAARQAAFEMAAKECEKLAKRFLDGPASVAYEDCAAAIRELAKR